MADDRYIEWIRERVIIFFFLLERLMMVQRNPEFQIALKLQKLMRGRRVMVGRWERRSLFLHKWLIPPLPYFISKCFNRSHEHPTVIFLVTRPTALSSLSLLLSSLLHFFHYLSSNKLGCNWKLFAARLGTSFQPPFVVQEWNSNAILGSASWWYGK